MTLLHKKNNNSVVGLALFLVLMLTLSACSPRGSGAGDSQISGSNTLGTSVTDPITGKLSPRSCAIDDMKSWVHENMLDYYLFYEQVNRTPDFANYNDIETLITALRVQPFDTFSYISDETSHTALFSEGQTFGFGWVLLRTDNDDFYFQMVEPQSPFANADVQRGDQLTHIGGYSMADFLQLPSTTRESILGTGNTIVTVEFGIRKNSGEDVNVSVTKAEYPVQTVLSTNVIEDNGLRIGYLHFYQFVDTAMEELESAFATLASSNIDELVLDLRYNGGGRISVASFLASSIVGNSSEARTFTTYKPNDKYAHTTSSINLTNVTYPLSLGRVFVLQGPYTCSASELIVNGLRPYMDVVTIGDTSCGKPYATIPNTACGKVMNALELDLVNANGVGGYYSGIAADCSVSENLSQALGSSDENLLAAALSYIDTGACSNLASRSRLATESLPGDLARPAFPGNLLQ